METSKCGMCGGTFPITSLTNNICRHCGPKSGGESELIAKVVSEENKEVTVTDINISFGTVFQLVLQFTIASAIVGGVIWLIFFMFTANS